MRWDVEGLKPSAGAPPAARAPDRAARTCTRQHMEAAAKAVQEELSHEFVRSQRLAAGKRHEKKHVLTGTNLYRQVRNGTGKEECHDRGGSFWLERFLVTGLLNPKIDGISIHLRHGIVHRAATPFFPPKSVFR